MKIEMKVKKINTDISWSEEYYIEDSIDPKEYADGLIAFFNSTLRPGEAARELVDVKILSYENRNKHSWEKTNLATKRNKYGYHDTYRCSKCGITGKLYGIGGDVIRDKRFEDLKYEFCK